MIRKADLADLDTIKKITEACTKDLIEHNIFQWTEAYQRLADFKKAIEHEALYAYLDNGKIVGCIMFSEEKDPLYNTVKWLTEDKKNLYIHRLAVHPRSQGKGIARKLMDFAENFAAKNGLLSIRLDTFSKNPRNIKFYKARGYVILGDVYFVNQSEYPFHCFEKQIKRI